MTLNSVQTLSFTNKFDNWIGMRLQTNLNQISVFFSPLSPLGIELLRYMMEQ